MTNELTRRQLLSAGAAASVAALLGPGIFACAAVSAEMPRRKFYPILSLGRLGFHASLAASLILTVNHGFECLESTRNGFSSQGHGPCRRLLSVLQSTNFR